MKTGRKCCSKSHAWELITHIVLDVVCTNEHVRWRTCSGVSCTIRACICVTVFTSRGALRAKLGSHQVCSPLLRANEVLSCCLKK